MPKKRPSTLPPRETYDSDGGFVEDTAPRNKKAKTGSTKPTRSEKVGSDGDGGATVGKDGEVFWELSGKRRVGVQEYKGNTMVNIREFYEKEGTMLPGKKGISLTVDQFNTLISLLPGIEKALVEKGEKVGRPDYGGAESSGAAGDEKEEGQQEAKAKKNFEETSDEE